MRLAFVKLANPEHRMPHPLNPSTLFPEGGETVDAENPVWMQLLNDGSLTEPPATKTKEKA